MMATTLKRSRMRSDDDDDDIKEEQLSLIHI